MTCVLEINDAAVTLYQGARVLARGPAVAVLLEDGTRFGDDAMRLSRIHPRQTNQQYFTRLNADPLPAPGKQARNHADLIYQHLQTLKPAIDAEGGDVLLAVPGVLTADQLGILLGVLQETGIAVRGFVDSAVAALCTQALPATACHVDVMLQRAVVTSVATDTSVAKTGAQEATDCGLGRLLEAWINVIADRFVRETRFDPLHAAATEQQLFDQLYGWIEGGAIGSELAVEVVHADSTRRVEIGRALLEEKTAQRLQPLKEMLPGDTEVFLSARSARLPGIHRVLADAAIAVNDLPEDALARGCADHMASILSPDGELRLITRLPAIRAAVTSELPPEPSAPPTHVLLGFEAWPVTAVPRLPIVTDGADDGALRLRPGSGARVNGAPADPERSLAAGDRISFEGDDYLLIQVRD